MTLLIAASVSVVGALVNTFATSVGMLIGSRAIMGAALGMQSTIGPPLMQELSHPRLRAGASAMWFFVYQFGSALAAWIVYGTLDWQSDWAWRLPTLFQMLGTGIIVVYIVTGQMEESPRYLMNKGKDEMALKTLAKLHANGQTDDPLVQYEMTEIRQGLEMDKNVSGWKDLIKTKGNRRRMFVLCFIAVSGQFAGNALVSYYLTPILKLVGITEPHQVAGINGGLAIFSTVNTAISAQFVERVGRRKMWLTAMIGVTVFFIIITALSGSFDSHPSKSVGFALVPMLYMFFCVSPTF